MSITRVINDGATVAYLGMVTPWGEKPCMRRLFWHIIVFGFKKYLSFIRYKVCETDIIVNILKNIRINYCINETMYNYFRNAFLATVSWYNLTKLCQTLNDFVDALYNFLQD